jgi:putative Ca2+/H+ antiporter (TMEM165/GDT1 family)
MNSRTIFFLLFILISTIQLSIQDSSDTRTLDLLSDKKKLNNNDHRHDRDDDDDDDDKKKIHIIKEKLPSLKDSEDSDEDNKSGSKNRHDSNSSKTNLGFIHAFLASISVILVSEIGDKTFFIAAIMAMKSPRMIVYLGAIFALGLMTLLSALLGNIVTKVVPRVYTYYFSSLLFALFGIKMMREGLQMSKDETTDEEYEEAQQSLRKSEEDENGNSSKNLEAGLSGGAAEADKSDDAKWTNMTRKFVVSLRKYISPIFLQAFILTFLAEWGDRSQISTIILGARENMIGTIIGGTIGHAICTGMAVLGGRFVAQRISVRNVTLCGAFVFLFFALSAFFIDPDLD